MLEVQCSKKSAVVRFEMESPEPGSSPALRRGGLFHEYVACQCNEDSVGIGVMMIVQCVGALKQ